MNSQGLSLDLQIIDESESDNSIQLEQYGKPFNEMVLFFFEQYFEDDRFEGKNIELVVNIVGESKIKVLNAQFRNKDKVTDVLSFPMWDNLRTQNSEESEIAAFEHIFLGEVFICLKKAELQAQEFGIDLYSEILHLFAHGFLHIMGFDHEIDESEEKLMENWEKRLLLQIRKS
ncbi:MAG: rRNA maturation RNase YbeY [Halobacteriovoraceae bacterium]|nr:rRNA maturation RNase YbeY [Halobacteriovoraceae bacterium]MCB9095488.1 rRNA maturation RNase YbeY [Halobacteriovoraceae bacterium]